MSVVAVGSERIVVIRVDVYQIGQSLAEVLLEFILGHHLEERDTLT